MHEKRIMLVGGGSGGHFYPLIAVAEKLRQLPDMRLYYMGPSTYDAEALRENNITFVRCISGKQRKYRSLLNFFDIFKVLWGVLSACVSLYRIYPDVIFSKGSYTSVPIVIAGFILRIPIVVHESDTKPGSANTLAGRIARYIAISFPETATYFDKQKIALTGIPLRTIFTTTMLDPHKKLGISDKKPIILVTGGSLGAQRLNDLVLESIDELLPAFFVVHQTGATHESNVQSTAASLITDVHLLDNYYIKGNLNAAEMSAAMSAASLIISRAGTGTIFEIAKKGKPAILVPIPESISHDQKNNAYTYARSGACSVLEEHNLTDSLLVSEISRIMGDQAAYASMSEAAASFSTHEAAEKIAQILVKVATEH